MHSRSMYSPRDEARIAGAMDELRRTVAAIVSPCVIECDYAEFTGKKLDGNPPGASTQRTRRHVNWWLVAVFPNGQMYPLGKPCLSNSVSKTLSTIRAARRQAQEPYNARNLVAKAGMAP